MRLKVSSGKWRPFCLGLNEFTRSFDDFIKSKHFQRYCPFVRGIHRSPVNSLQEDQWSFDVFFDLRPNKWLSKQSWGCWFETPSRPVWWHRNGYSNPLNHAQVNNFDNIWGLMKLYYISSPILFLKSIWYFHGTYYLICSKQHIVYNFKVIGSIPWLYCNLCNDKQVTLQIKGENLLAVPHQPISKATGVLSTMRTPLVFFGNFQSMYVSYHSRNSADALVMGKSWALDLCIFKLRPPRCDFSNYAIITN